MIAQSLVSPMKRSRFVVFGVSIDAICRRENKLVPTIVRWCIERIRKCDDGIKTHGLFRVSGEKSEVMKLEDMLNNSTMQRVFSACARFMRRLCVQTG